MKRIQEVDTVALRGHCRHAILQSLRVSPAIVGAQAVLDQSQIGLGCVQWRAHDSHDILRVREASALSLLNLMRSGVVTGQVGPGGVTTYSLTSPSHQWEAVASHSAGALRPVIQAVALSACLAGCASQPIYQVPRYSYFVQPSSHQVAPGSIRPVATLKTPVESVTVPMQGWSKGNTIQRDQPLAPSRGNPKNASPGGAPLQQPSTGAHLDAAIEPQGLPQPVLSVQNGQQMQQPPMPSVQTPSAATASYLPLKKSVYFEFGKSEVHADMREVVQSMLPLMRVAKSFRVTGVTDGFGDRAVNETLAKSRAQAVAQALRSYGVVAERIDVQTCTTASCWQRSAAGVVAHRLNRRVDIEVLVPRSIAMGLRDQFVEIETVAALARPGPAAQRG